MGEGRSSDLRVQFDARLRLKLHGTKVTHAAGRTGASEASTVPVAGNLANDRKISAGAKEKLVDMGNLGDDMRESQPNLGSLWLPYTAVGILLTGVAYYVVTWFLCPR